MTTTPKCPICNSTNLITDIRQGTSYCIDHPRAIATVLLEEYLEREHQKEVHHNEQSIKEAA